MANTKNNVQPQVVTTTTTTTSRRGRRRRRRANRPSQPTTTTVRRVTTARQATRPRRGRRNRFGTPGKSAPSSIRQRITATLGTVGSNQGNDIEMEMACLLNPALMKETTGSNQHGPLQIYASTYSLWRIERIILKLTPLVGPSAVSGTAVRASYNPSGQPGSPSWSALGARRHRDTNPGRPLYFVLSGKEFKGPKDGWFFCNTKNDPQMCTAGSLEIHTLGQTISTYQNKQFDGPLFLAEMTCDWSFKGYNPMPGMLTLVKAELKEKEQTVKIHSKPGEPITMSVPADSPLARATGVMESNVDAAATPSEIVWMICDTTMDAVTGNLPVPFSWLFKAGWWFVKRIANKKKNGAPIAGEPNPGEVTYQVFQSMTDALNDTPCIATSNAESANAKVTGWNITQVTPGSIGLPAASSSAARRMIGIDTTKPFYLARNRALAGEAIITGINFSGGANGRPLNGFSVKDVASNRRAHSYNTYECLDPFFFQDGEIDPATADVPTYPMYQKQADNFIEIGTIYATAGTTLGEPRTPSYIQWRIALWKATKTIDMFVQPTSERDTQFFFIQPSITIENTMPRYTHKLVVTPGRSFGQTTYSVVEGRWYITVFSALNGNTEFTNYGAPYYLPQSIYTQGQVNVEPTNETYSAGLAMMNAIPLKFSFNQPTAQSVTFSMVQRLVQQALEERENQDMPFPPLPPPSDYDNLEMPPLEGDEEEEQGAVGGEELQRDIKNWVEFGHRKRPPTPFSPIEEEEEEEEESDLDDDDYAEVPSFIKNLLTPEAKKLLDDLKKMGLDHEKAVKAAQGAYPHPAVEKWEAAYHNALVDGLSPPSARDCAWGEISDYL